MTIPKDVLKFIEHEIDPAFAERARFICDNIWRHKPARILDVGCGRGFYLKLLSKAAFVKEVVGIDINPSRVREVRDYFPSQTKLTLSCGSANQLPLKAESFDCVICSEVLEHLKDDAGAVNEIKKVLRPQGLLVVSVPNMDFPFLWDPLNWILMRFFETHLPSHIHWLGGIWADHERLYAAEELKHLIEKRFEILDLNKVLSWCWPFSHHLLYGVGKNLVFGLKLRNLNRFSDSSQNPFALALAMTMRLPQIVMARGRPQVHKGVNLVLAAIKR